MTFDGALELLDAFLAPESDPRQARRREAILRAATDLFVALGYRKTSIDDVAGAAGVAKGTVYLYYRNKADLLLHAIALQKRQYLAELQPVLELEPVERLRALIVLGVTLGHELPLMSRSPGGDHEIEQVLREADTETLARINAMQIAFVADLIDEATGHGWPREALEERAQLLVDLTFAVVNGGRLIRDGMPLEAYARVLADVLVDGLLEPPGAPARRPAARPR